MADYRFYVSSDDVGFYNDSKILKSLPTNKDKFLVLLGYGYVNDAFIPVEKKKTKFLISNTFDEEDKALLYAVAIKRKGGIENINEEEDEVFEIANAYANGGLQLLRRLEQQSSHDNYLKSFEKKINNHLEKLNK